MADNITTQSAAPSTAPAGAVIATDQKTIASTPVHVQRVNLAIGGDGDYTGDTDGRLVDGDASSSALFVDQRTLIVPVSVTSAGLTNSTYASGDQLGNQFTFAGAARATAGSGRVANALLIDKADVLGAVDMYLFNATVTPAADNAANAWSDADMAKCVGIIRFSTFDDSANNRILQATNCPVQYVCAATSLFGCLVTRTANAAIPNATDIIVTLLLALD